MVRRAQRALQQSHQALAHPHVLARGPRMKINPRDIEFRRWYDARQGTKYESFAYDAWCAAWEAATMQQELKQAFRQGFHMNKKQEPRDE